MKANNSKEGHCDYNDFKRARYFDGEILNKQIFEAEQSYHHEKRKLLNRMLHGWGVVCGLKVKATNPPSSNIIVEPGLALDCQGNEIYVCEEQTVDLSAKPCMKKTQKSICENKDDTEPEDTALYVVIRYDEINSDPVPSYAPSVDCGEKKCSYSRTREGFCIEVRDELPDAPKPNSTNMLCSEPFKCPTCYCCPDPHYIVLATIRCGKRTYMFFSNDTIKYGEKTAEISYQIGRELSSVCLYDTSKIRIHDVYKFKTNSNFYDSFEWYLGFSKPGNEFTSEPKDDEYWSDFVVNRTYNIFANKGTKGSVHMGVPVSLTFYDESKKIIDKQLNLTLQSPIYIGTADKKRGSIISDAMIRNMENRQLVITYPLISWLTSPLLSSLLNNSGSEEGQLSSDNLVNSFCRLMENDIFQEYSRKYKARISIESEEERINQTVKKYLDEHLKPEKDKKIVETTGSRYGAIKK